jgi:hypothetical protein
VLTQETGPTRAILLVGDDFALKAKFGIDEKEFIKQARSLKGEEQLNYIRKNAERTSS